MTTEATRTCPECNSQMGSIAIIDRSRIDNFLSVDGLLSYAAPDAKPGYWSGAIPAEGVVDAYACTSCGRIVLYAKKA